VKRLLQLLVSLGISGVALWLMLRGKDLSAIAAAAWAADHRYLLGYFLVLSVVHVVRTVRWGLLLEPVARVPFAKLNSVCAVGFMALFILPLRLGEFARPYLVAERPRLRISAALSSVVVERVVDGLFAAALLVLTLLAIPEGSPNLRLFRGAGWVMLAGFSGLVVFLVVAYLNRALAVRFTRRLLGPISIRLADRAAGMMDAFIHGLRLVPTRKKLLLFFAFTFLYWGLNGWGMQLLARGFGLRLTALQIYTVLGVLLAGVMIPAGPGMVGTFQYAVVMGLSLFVPARVADVQGQAYANTLWAAQLAHVTTLGLFFLFSRHIQLARVFRAQEEVEEELEAEEAEYQEDEIRAGAGAGERRAGS